MERLRLRSGPWLLPIAAAVVLTPLYVRFGSTTVAAAALYHTAALGGTAAIVLTVVRRKFGFGWRILALGFVAWAGGDIVWCLHDMLGVSGAPVDLENAF